MVDEAQWSAELLERRAVDGVLGGSVLCSVCVWPFWTRANTNSLGGARPEFL